MLRGGGAGREVGGGLVVDALRAAGHRPQGDAAGAHLVVRLPDGSIERAVLAAAAARRVRLDGLTRHHAATPGATGVVLGYAGPTREELDRALAVLHGILGGGPAVPAGGACESLP